MLFTLSTGSTATTLRDSMILLLLLLDVSKQLSTVTSSTCTLRKVMVDSFTVFPKAQLQKAFHYPFHTCHHLVPKQ